MSEAEEDYDEQEAPRPSLAIPPLYVLRVADHCPVCGAAQHVYTLGCAAYQDADFGSDDPIEEFHFLRQIESVPSLVLRVLKHKCPSFYLDRAKPKETPYLMNHCRCGAKLDEDWVSGDVGAAFMPDTPDGYKGFKLHRLSIDEPIPVESSYALGGGEYLDFSQVW